jgi:poly-gamma-glutamate capsule biosynthesis protein CapA/YwtB (metallophosphatase superfamily)
MNIILVGDIAPIMRVEKGKSYKYINYSVSESVKKIIADADVSIGNLETTITDSFDYVKGKPVVYKIPKDKANILKIFTYLNVANNHILDYKYKGMQDTIKYLNDNHIYHTGSGENTNGAAKYVIINKKNKKIAIFSGTDHPIDWACNERNKGCVNYLEFGSFETLKKIRNIIEDIKKHDIDLIIFSYHYGPNYKDDVSIYKDFLLEILDKGVDVIHDHSAHHISRISKIPKNNRNRYIIYSNGEFINDYGWESYEKEKYKMDHTFMVRIKFDEHNNIHLSIIPTKINYEFNDDPLYYAGVSAAKVELAKGIDKEYICNVVNHNNKKEDFCTIVY